MKKSYDWMPQNTQWEIWMIHLKDQMQRKQSESSVKPFLESKQWKKKVGQGWLL